MYLWVTLRTPKRKAGCTREVKMSNYKDVHVQTLTPIRHWLAVECTGGQGAFKNWKHRYFVLQDVFLYYYQKPTDKKPKGVVNIEGATVTVCSCTTLRCQQRHLHQPNMPRRADER